MPDRKKILLIDDDNSGGRAIRSTLNPGAFSVIGPIENAEHAIQIAREVCPDLILMNINLAENHNGQPYCREFNRQIKVPVIYFSAQNDSQVADPSDQTESFGILHMPISGEEIQSTIDMVLHKYDSIQEISRNVNILSTTLHSIDDALVVSDTDFQIIYINPKAEKLFGKPAAGLLGTDLGSLISLIQDENGHPVENPCKKINDSRDRILLPDDCLLVNFRNQRVPVNGSFSVILDEKKQPEGMIVLLRDISGRKRVEQDLIHARDAAEEMNRVKTTLLANMSHEMRTPLTGILGFSSILESDLPEGEAREMATRIHLSGRRLLETIESILDLAKLESEKVDIQIEQVNIIDEINRGLEVHASSARVKGLKLSVQCELKELIVDVDRQLFNRVMYNLFTNALKYTEEGNITVYISKLQKGGTSYAQVDVQDTGVGISPDFLPKVFDEFQQESTGISRKFEGSGLGLTISRKLIEAMGGSITVNSKKGEGAMFSIRLPLKKEKARSAGESEPVDKELDGSQKPHILLVEDDYDSSLITRFYLGEDFNVTIVDSGEKAINILRSHNFQLVIMDISLGAGIDGVTALKELRSKSLLDNTPVIALTAHALSGDSDYYLNMGFSEYLSKPFKKDELIRIVEKLI